MKLQFVAYFFLSLIVSMVFIPLLIFLSKKYHIYDQINDRKIHEGQISRLGGFAIYAGFLVSYILLSLFELHLKFNFPLYTIALSLAFFTGFSDDLFTYRARYKLIVQIICGILVVSSGLTITEVRIFDIVNFNFGPFSYIITVLWIVTLMNAVNLLDGMDGLASGIVLIANVFVFIIALSCGNITIASLTMVLAGAILGFYFFNFPPAKIFMGDGGAYFLGFMYATLPLMGIKTTSVATLFIFPLILILVPIADILNVVIKRIKLGYNIFIADKNHIHHRLMNLGFSIRKILLILYAYTVILGLLSLLILNAKPGVSLIFFFLIFVIMFLSFYLLNSAEKIIEKRENRNNCAD